jgi:glycosyltransferase involved in cell wall biosynthesis
VSPRVLHLSTYDVRGGAARSAFALHSAMVEAGINSVLQVALKTVDNPTVVGPAQAGARRNPKGLRFLIANELEHRLWGLQRSSAHKWRSPAYFGSLSARTINATDADVVNIHWATDGFLSIKEIGRITKPVVWSFCDMWPFAGTEHYGDDSPDARWRHGYTKANRLADDRGFDLDRHAWERKKKWWRKPCHVVTASTWMNTATKSSALMGHWPTHTISHVIDCDTFHPMPMHDARQGLGLPLGVPLILFISSGGVDDSRKGWDLLEAALPEVRHAHPNAEVVIVGPATLGYQTPTRTPIHWIGEVKGDAALNLYYNSANVTVVPSREDNMPLTAMEAQSCGRPVVGFAIGGLPDIVSHEKTGYLAEPFVVNDLAHGLISAIGDSLGANMWSQSARLRASQTWSREAVVPQYLAVYKQACS